MRSTFFLASTIVLAAASFGLYGIAQEKSATDKANVKGTAEAAAAAKKFLATLDGAQRGKVVFDFNDEAQRKRWSNLPVGSVPRAGLRMGDLSAQQRDAAMAVLSAALSKQGYEKIVQIVEGDEVLRIGGRGGPGDKGGKNGPGDKGGKGGPGDKGGKGGQGGKGGGGGGLGFGRDNYYISFLGQPSETDSWMIQFGGHHLGINVTFAGPQGTLTPSHTGVQPARFELEGKTVRPLGHETDKAFALVGSLDEAQRKQAILGFQMRDLVLGPGRDGQTIAPEGIKGSALSDKQREMLLDLASEWTAILHDGVARTKMDEMKKNIAETWFAWSGPTEPGSAAYFRIQGPTVVIEYAPQRLGGDPTNHIHTIYRDPTNEYGRAPTKK